VDGISMKPGATAMARILKTPNSLAKTLVRASTPALAAE
jgi:hypothetical protein